MTQLPIVTTNRLKQKLKAFIEKPEVLESTLESVDDGTMAKQPSPEDIEMLRQIWETLAQEADGDVLATRQDQWTSLFAKLPCGTS